MLSKWYGLDNEPGLDFIIRGLNSVLILTFAEF